MLRRWRRDDGALSAEFVAVLPLLLLMAIVGWQLITIVSAGSVTANAARNGARAVSLGQSCSQVVNSSLPGWLSPATDISCDTGGSSVRVEVEVEVPNLFRGMPWEPFRVSRAAELPRTD